MLKFILGKPACGKSFNIINKVAALARSQKQSLIIVPEQFTFETERAVLRALGDNLAQSVSVLSFSRIADEVGRLSGGISAKALSDAEKIIFMNKALKNSAENLKLWGRYVNSVSFAQTLLDTVSEFKLNFISFADVKKASHNAKGSLALKLEDLGEIYSQYDMLVGEKFIDTNDSLTRLYEKLENYEFFKGKTVFFDSFKSFTGQQLKIVERIISQADDIYMAFTYKAENRTQYGLFSNIEKTVERIKKIALAYGVFIEEPEILRKSFYNSPELSSLEALILNDKLDAPQKSESIVICNAATIFDEAQFAARTIRKLVRTKGYRYRDFVIIARDTDIYSQSVASACKQNGIPLFFDKRMPLSAFPLAVATKSAIEALGLSTEGILKFNKTGLGNLNRDEISLLENYTYIWNISGELWLRDWDMNPRGLVSSASLSESEKQELLRLNELRNRAIEPILHFKDNFKGDAKAMAKAIFDLFEECDVSGKLLILSEHFKNSSNITYEILKQCYSEYMQILDSLVTALGTGSIKTCDFTDALNIAVATASIGVLPQMLDEVTFGAADRIRPSRPKIAIVLGLNQGVFPKLHKSSGIFNLGERRSLIENGFEISDNSVNTAIDEEFLIYTILCCASDMVYITYSNSGSGGEEKMPSAIVEEIKERLNPVTVFEPLEGLSVNNLPETELSAFSELCRIKSSDLNGAETIKHSLKAINNEALTQFEAALFVNKNSLSKETARELFGEKIRMSASRFDTFNRCRFSYFCRYGLSADKLQPAQFDVLQRGTVVHYVMERLVGSYGENISQLSKADLERLTDEFIAEYLNSVIGYRSVENSELKFLVSRLSRSLKAVVIHIAAELSQSDFKPIGCEVKIGNNETVKSPVFPYDGGEISLSGSIDRVDGYNGYIRVIDYKTGAKKFALSDILFGLNLQMLIYLYAYIKSNEIAEDKAAGILYQPSKRDTKGGSIAMNGLLQRDISLVTAMDKSGSGEFVPKLNINKDGSFAKRNNSFIDSKDFGEIFKLIERLMAEVGNKLSSGDIAVSPVDGRDSEACKYCDFAFVCGIENGEISKVPDLSNDEILKVLREGDTDGL